MQLTAKHTNLQTDLSYIIIKVKEIIARYDEAATLILFGSRARGDWHKESDWDFLVLSNLPEDSDAKEKIRTDIRDDIELETFDVINIIMHNKNVWENKYHVTPLYYNIEEEGISVT